MVDEREREKREVSLIIEQGNPFLKVMIVFFWVDLKVILASIYSRIRYSL